MRLWCGCVRTCMAVARRLLHPKEGLAPPEAEKLTAPVSLTRPGITPAPYGQPLSGPGHEATPPPVLPPQAGSFAAQNTTKARKTTKAPIEFDIYINHVVKVKKTFGDKPGTYRAFLEILHAYQKEQNGASRMSMRRCLASSRTTPSCSPSSGSSIRTGALKLRVKARAQGLRRPERGRINSD